MKKGSMMVACIAVVLCVGQAGAWGSRESDKQADPALPPGVSALSLVGGSTWGGGLTANAQRNVLTVKGKVASAGYVHTGIRHDVAGKTLTLEFSNSGKSTFSGGRMIKVTCNAGDTLLKPNNANLIEDEYIPAEDGTVEFTLPGDFDGKLGFVFYQADLRDLRITASVKN
jgi:hypothetical protein